MLRAAYVPVIIKKVPNFKIICFCRDSIHHICYNISMLNKGATQAKRTPKICGESGDLMNAYLYFENNPYYQNSTIKEEIESSKEFFFSEDDLLPETIPPKYADVFPDKLVFHAHHFMEITRLVKGRMLYVVEKKVFSIHPGDIIVFNSFVPHAWIFLDDDMELIDYSFADTMVMEPSNPQKQNTALLASNNVYLNIWHNKPGNGRVPIITNSDEFVMRKDFMLSMINSTFRVAHIKQGVPTHNVFFTLLDDIDMESNRKQFAYEYIVHAKIMEFLAQLFRFHAGVDVQSIRNMPDVLLSALEYISQNLHQNLRLEDVAKHCYLSPQYFSTYFKKYVGMNFSKYLVDLRLKRAMKEIINTNKAILEVAYQCGFNSKTSFYRAWYSKYQVTPLQIRSVYRPNLEEEV